MPVHEELSGTCFHVFELAHHGEAVRKVGKDWESQLKVAVKTFFGGVGEETERLQKLEAEVARLKDELAKVTTTIPIQTFEPEPYELLPPVVYVVIQPVEESFVATHVDANINASGETVPDAVENLKDMMITLYERLSKEKKSKLGKGPTRQLAVLQTIFRRKKRDVVHHERAREKTSA
jgi:hypothetical protein